MKEIVLVNILLKNLSKQLYEDDDDLKLISGSESEFLDLLNQVRRRNACLLYVADIKTHRLRKELRADISSVIYRTEDVIDELLVKRMLIKERCYYYIWPAKRLFIMSSSRRNKVVLKSASQVIKNLLDRMVKFNRMVEFDKMVEPPGGERLAFQKFRLVANVVVALGKTVHQQSTRVLDPLRGVSQKSRLLKNVLDDASTQTVPQPSTSVVDPPRGSGQEFHHQQSTIEHHQATIMLDPLRGSCLKFRLLANVLVDALPKTVHQQSTSVLDPPRGCGYEGCARVVGYSWEAEKLIKRLIEGPEDPDVVPIVGIVGLGKTTLAKEIYSDSRIIHEFHFKYWVNVHQFELKDICLSILERLERDGINVEYDEDMDVRELAERICDILAERDGRCLFVLDDVRTSEVVDLFKIIFRKNKKRHRILMTTRIGYVATYANEDPHYLKHLSRDESSEFLIGMCGGKSTLSKELVGIGISIAEQCSGVPLLLVLVANSLKIRPEIREWHFVERDMMKRVMDKRNRLSIYPFVKESYDRLTEDMKLCFLYLGVFPLDFQIPAQKLIRLWIAECLINFDSDFDSISLEERAEICLNALVDRNLVIVTRKRLDGKIKTCRVHELLHAFCKFKAEKWLFKLVSEDTVTESTVNKAETTRRLCIQSTVVLKNFLSTKPVAKHVRSFYCFHSEQSQMGLFDSYSQLIPKAFPLLRVLEIGSLNPVFPKDFNQLYHLKYISISGDFKALPEAFGKFWNLQTLLINTTTSEPTLAIEASIWNLLQLRHLHTNIPAKLLSSPNPTGKDSCLQTLSVVAPESCRIDVFAKAFNLKKLGIRGDMGAFLSLKFSNLEDIRCLEHLKLYNDGSNKFPLPPSFQFLRTLKKLTLSNTMFDWSDANILGQLGSLEVLKLKQNAFMGKSWKSERGGFSQLQVLWIEKANLETWKASELHFPRLRHLVLISCEDLKAVPSKLADVHSFKEMRLENTHGAVRSAREIECKKLESIKFKLTIFPPDADY
ncbi:putative late blight resistance protein homolog R1A-10 [Lycium barbarum]|uniref:putative late blight resistance protein homolog R1A-10 n=1 Tax=Lycium barbarum TaxID=112863 RepID=UPI00293EDD6F|nr:putative late blight resistance protein homolog R1A-10 [Lycium barbarum]